jgi:hypothetical protein
MIIPQALTGIPDLEQLYDAIDDQVEKLNDEVDQLDEDTFFDTMSENRVKRWENMISLTPGQNDSLDDRRFRIQSRVVDKLPYSYRIILSDLHALDPEAQMEIDWEHLNVKVYMALSSQSMVADVEELLEKKLPLNLTYEIIIVYNTWGEYESDTWGDVSTMTWQQMKENE